MFQQWTFDYSILIFTTISINIDLTLDIQRFKGLIEGKFEYERSKEKIFELLHKYLYVD